MKAAIVFDSRYGNTEKIANDIATGLKQKNIEVACFRTSEIQIDKLRDYDLVAVGGPTEIHRASASIREFLSKLKHVDLKGKYGFAFDTKLNSRWAGDASSSIEHTLKDSGVQILKPHSSAFVTRPPKEEFQEPPESPETKEDRKARKAEEKELKRASAVLEEGEEEKFEQIGEELGRMLVQTHPVS